MNGTSSSHPAHLSIELFSSFIFNHAPIKCVMLIFTQHDFSSSTITRPQVKRIPIHTTSPASSCVDQSEEFRREFVFYLHRLISPKPILDDLKLFASRMSHFTVLNFNCRVVNYSTANVFLLLFFSRM